MLSRRNFVRLGAAGLLAPMLAWASFINMAGGRYNTPSDNWATRSAGAIVANRLDTLTTINSWKVADSTADHVSLDTTNKVDGAAGSLKFAVLNADDSASGSLSIPFGRTFTEGDTVYFQYRVRFASDEVYQGFPISGGAESGIKYSIFSRDANGAAPQGSNEVNEVVGQINYQGGLLTGYNQDGSGYPSWDSSLSDACSGSDFIWQNQIDNGTSPLSGNNPETGSAWTSCQQARARYGGLYSAKSATHYRVGYGDPLSGGVRPTPDQFDTIEFRVEIVSLGGGGNRITEWVEPLGGTWRTVVDQLVTLGSGPVYNGLTLLPYVTNRIPGGRHVSSRTSNIGGTAILAVGRDTAIGDATLEYVASTGLFRFHDTAESFGVSSGYSAANNILKINVASGTTADSFVLIKVTPGSLPSSGTTTDTVTIADGRPDTQRNYNDFILNTSAIIGPSGDTPVLP